MYYKRNKQLLNKNKYNKDRSNDINNLSEQIESCTQKTVFPKFLNSKSNDYISILGPVGLSYIQYKNTEILLFPEMHSYGTDEDNDAMSDMYKPMINIENIMNSIIENKSVCVDYYHEDIRYRKREYKQNAGNGYKAYENTVGHLKYRGYQKNTVSLDNTMVHYTEFRSTGNEDFIIWDFLQKDYSHFLNPEVIEKKIPTNIVNNVYIDYLNTPYKLVKLAEAYYLSDDFEQSIRELFPEDFIKVFFTFNTLKKFRGKWVHPIRKEILKCNDYDIIIKFLNNHIQNLLNGDKEIGKELDWYFEQYRSKIINKNIAVIINEFKSRHPKESLDINNMWLKNTELTNSKLIEILNHKNLIKQFHIFRYISLYLGDLLVDSYTLSRMLRYIEERKTNVSIFYGGWAHPYTIHRFFDEMLSNDKDVIFKKEYGRHAQIGNFNHSDSRYSGYRKKYSFNMPYEDFDKIFSKFGTWEVIVAKQKEDLPKGHNLDKNYYKFKLETFNPYNDDGYKTIK